MHNGWVKIHRKLEEWEWYLDIPVKILFLHLLLRANHKDKKWRGKLVEKGCLITSYSHLSLQTALSIQQVRTALDKLKSTSEVTIKTSNKFTYIKLNNWKEYQSPTSNPTNEQQTSNKQVTTNKNVKNEKNVNKLYSSENKKDSYNDFDRFKLGDGCIARLKYGQWVDDASEVPLDLHYYIDLPTIN